MKLPAFVCAVILMAGSTSASSRKVGCIYNGYILTVDPVLALSVQSAEFRHCLFVLNALLINTQTGKIVATYPQLPSQHTSGPVARRITDCPELMTDETPAAPGITLNALETYWRNQGIDEQYFQDIRTMNIDGSVVTPGIVDSHFHVTSWSKKVPEHGKRFGFWADLGDMIYYTNPATMDRLTTRESLWRVVIDANMHLQDIGRDRLYLHGFIKSAVDDPVTGDLPSGAFMYESGGSPSESVRNPLYLLNRIGTSPDAPTSLPADPNDPATWPSLNYETAPVVMIHTSGQACWYNPPVMDEFNLNQETVAGGMFTSVPVSSFMPPAPPETSLWTFEMDPDSDIFVCQPNFTVDMVAWPDEPANKVYIPFLITEMDPSLGILRGQPFFVSLADTFIDPETPVTVTPFYRLIAPVISEHDWDQAAEFYGSTPTIDDIAYGFWDPRRPYGTNWYNGSERGLIEYFHDRDAGVWRPTGYAEHYVMRDALSYFVAEQPTVEDCMTHRRRLVEWCHRHGITAVNDIMFYRRENNLYEFDSYEALSWDHSEGSFNQPGRRTSLEKQPFNLRVGMYYYIENASDIPPTLRLAHDAGNGYDTDRLMPDSSHPEWPGWIRWLGWKLQLDGGTGARTLCSNALITKSRCNDEYSTVDQNGNSVTFRDHSYGLLTMSNRQEQIFNSRETAALYWLVRESNPSSPFYNPAISTDYSFLSEGVTDFLNRSISPATLTDDLNALEHIEWPEPGEDQDQPGDMAVKIVNVLNQMQDGYHKTITAAAAIWYQHSLALMNGKTLPKQTVCHCAGDGAVDLWCHAIKEIRDDLQDFPDSWDDLPDYWKAAIPSDTDLHIIQRTFHGERFRVEHLINFSYSAAQLVMGPDGLNQGIDPFYRNVVFSTQPSLLACDGQAMRDYAFPPAQELWPIPNGGDSNFWLGVPWRPRSHHHMPCPLWSALDIPFTLNTDPPSIRDPRPAVTLAAAVARTPFDVNPSLWVGATSDTPVSRPPDYLAGKIEMPLGLTSSTPDNPMGLTIEQALTAMTFWGAYSCGSEDRFGALAAPLQPGTSWYADMVVWRSNPLVFKGSSGIDLETLARTPDTVPEAARLEVINLALSRFLPQMTFIGGEPVWQLGVRVNMPLLVRPGDPFFIRGYLDNPGPPLYDAAVFFVLEAYGDYWFWPSWMKFEHSSSEIDFLVMDLATGTTGVDVLPAFTWPDAGTAGGLRIYGAFLNSEMTDIMGEMAMVEFGCAQ